MSNRIEHDLETSPKTRDQTPNSCVTGGGESLPGCCSQIVADTCVVPVKELADRISPIPPPLFVDAWTRY